jgi:hypothetical protein
VSDFEEDFIGPLATLPPEFASAAADVKAFVAKTALAENCYVPAQAEDFSPEIAVCFAPFSWGPGAPSLWVMTTVGLSAVTQPSPSDATRRVPKRFELCAGFEFRPTPPSDRAVVDGQSWSANELLSAFVTNFAFIAHDLLDWQRQGAEPYGLGSVFDDIGLSKRLPAGVLVPPMNELRQLGVQPFNVVNGAPVGIGLSSKEWMNRETLLRPAEVTFLQLAPLLKDEWAAANQWGGWNFFVGGLLATAPEMNKGLNASAHIFDLGRESRVAPFEAWRRERMA